MLTVCGGPVVFIVGLGLPTIGHTRSSGQKVAKGSHVQALEMRVLPNNNNNNNKNRRDLEDQRVYDGSTKLTWKESGRSWGPRHRLKWNTVGACGTP